MKGRAGLVAAMIAPSTPTRAEVLAALSARWEVEPPRRAHTCGVWVREGEVGLTHDLDELRALGVEGAVAAVAAAFAAEAERREADRGARARPRMRWILD